MKKDIFYVAILTIFAVLFIFTYFSYRSLEKKYEHAKEILKAYELYIFSDYESFANYVEKEGLEIDGIDMLKDKKARSLLAQAKDLYKLANYGEALVLFEKAMNLSSNEEIRKIASFYIEECKKKLAGE
ncbi:hypothetical protein [Thermotoga sp. KOL6]|uniref:hypothetical protein n=1 Tax=Thermotoga sp. KOL6 TaxID=126741 RepID=UPI000C788DF0|nr:hypothetical protein [Thermotoga sp. KOL6]PLV60286.1 hypothetical protein AS005_03055 [Thermotoga sp. KOL6]